jgi:hypothetical protein
MQMEPQYVIELCSKSTLTKMESLFSESPFDVNSSYKGISALMAAVAKNKIDVAEFLITKGADVNFCSEAGNALMEACKLGNMVFVERLLAAGARKLFLLPMKRGDKRKTKILEEISKTGTLEAVKYFAPLQKDVLNQAALNAAEYGQTDILEFLLTEGAQAGLLNKNGLNLAVLVSWSKRPLEQRQKSIAYLFENGVSKERLAVFCTDLWPWLIESFSYSMEYEPGSDHPVFVAIAQNNPVTLEYLIRNGVRTDFLGMDRQFPALTPYQYAVQKKRPTCVRILLSHGIGEDDAKADAELQAKRSVKLPVWIPTIVNPPVPASIEDAIILILDTSILPEAAKHNLGLTSGFLYIKNEEYEPAVEFRNEEDPDIKNFLNLSPQLSDWEEGTDGWMDPESRAPEEHKLVEKLGGWPSWIQGEEVPKCQQCRKPMVFVYQRIFGGDGDTYFIFHCKDHPEKWKVSVQNY